MGVNRGLEQPVSLGTKAFLRYRGELLEGGRNLQVHSQIGAFAWHRWEKRVSGTILTPSLNRLIEYSFRRVAEGVAPCGIRFFELVAGPERVAIDGSLVVDLLLNSEEYVPVSPNLFVESMA